MASGILVGTIFVNLVKLHRIEEICGELMHGYRATNRKCGQDMYIFIFILQWTWQWNPQKLVLNNCNNDNTGRTSWISQCYLRLIMPWVPKQDFCWLGR